MTRQNKSKSKDNSTKKTAAAEGKSILIKYLKEYLRARHNLDDFEKRVTDQMAAYEGAEERKRKEILEKGDQPDEEGFITVVSKKPKVFEGERAAPTVAADAFPVKTLSNFYKLTGTAHQLERSRQLDELRKEFDEDKKKLAKLKEAKIFRPL